MDIWDYVKARQFFKRLPEIKNFNHKIAGKNTKGNKLDFSDKEKKAINRELEKLIQQLKLK